MATSVLLNSHLLSEVELVCDRVAILLTAGRRGGSPAELARAARGGDRDRRGRRAVFKGATREDAPRLVAELVAAGSADLRRPRAHLDARGDLPRSGRRARRRELGRGHRGYGLREALRRKVFVGRAGADAWIPRRSTGSRTTTSSATSRTSRRRPGSTHSAFAGAFMVGLAMFATLFLGVVLAVFLTLGVVRGDAERGLLQPLVVRPIGRSTLLFARWLGGGRRVRAVRRARLPAAMVITGLTGRLVARPHRHAGRSSSPPASRSSRRSRCSARSSSPRRRTGSRSSCSSAPDSSPDYSARSATRSIRPARALGDDRRVARSVRGALPGWAAPADRQHDRADRLPARPRPVRRRLHGRHRRARLGRLLPRRRPPARNGRIFAPRPLITRTSSAGSARTRPASSVHPSGASRPA